MRWPVWRAVVAEGSMEPGLRPGDRLLLARPVRASSVVRVRAGQVVVARMPGDERVLIIKRAILAEPDGWFLDSDNPGAGAVDSWRFGTVPVGLIEGRLLYRYWPPRLRSPHLESSRRRAGPPGHQMDPGGDGRVDHPRPDQGT